MSGNGAGVGCVLRALTCALAVSCGSDVEGPERDPEEEVQLTSSDVSDDTAAALEAARCASYRDDEGLSETRITIRNERRSPIFLLRERTAHDCQLPALFTLAHAGVRVNVHSAGDCDARSCERLQEEGYVAGACSDECDAPAPLIRLEPGATLEAGAFDGERVSHGAPESTSRMPARCVATDAGVPAEGVACSATHALEAGRYRVSARAFASLECDGRRSCECSRTTLGWCLLDRRHRSRGPALEATLELELPAESATLTFDEH